MSGIIDVYPEKCKLKSQFIKFKNVDYKFNINKDSDMYISTLISVVLSLFQEFPNQPYIILAQTITFICNYNFYPIIISHYSVQEYSILSEPGILIQRQDGTYTLFISSEVVQDYLNRKKLNINIDIKQTKNVSFATSNIINNEKVLNQCIKLFILADHIANHLLTDCDYILHTQTKNVTTLQSMVSIKELIQNYKANDMFLGIT